MTVYRTDNQIIHFNKKFGFITDNQIILTNRAAQNKIRIDNIDKIDLLKRRIFYSNVILFSLSVGIISFTYFFFESEKKQMYITLAFLGIVLLAYSLFHKFYHYKIIIKEKDNSIIEVKSNQINKKNIKDFYNTIAKMVRKSTKK